MDLIPKYFTFTIVKVVIGLYTIVCVTLTLMYNVYIIFFSLYMLSNLLIYICSMPISRTIERVSFESEWVLRVAPRLVIHKKPAHKTLICGLVLSQYSRWASSSMINMHSSSPYGSGLNSHIKKKIIIISLSVYQIVIFLQCFI